MLGLVIQMWTMLIATLENVRIFLQIREMSPQDPPRARCAFLSSPHKDKLNKLLTKIPLILLCTIMIDDGLFDCRVLPQQGRKQGG